MSAKPETTFIASVHRQFEDGCKPYLMKNHNEYVGGVADVWYSGNKGDLWVEYKFLVLPKRPTTVIDLTAGAKPMLSVLQQTWLRERHAEGRNVRVVVGFKAGAMVLETPADWEAPWPTSAYLSLAVSRKVVAQQIVSITGSS